MSQINQENQKLSPSALVALYQLDCSVFGGPVINFTDRTYGGDPVIFGGVYYQPIPIVFDGMEVNGVGALPRPTLTLADVGGGIDKGGIVHALIATWGDLAGATLKRIRTYQRFLDGEPEADPLAYIGPDVFELDRISDNSPEAVTWEIAVAADQQGREIGRPVIRDTCLFRYREWNAQTSSWDYSKAKCPYTGSSYFDINNASVGSAALDVPSRSLTCCKKRFGNTAILPFGGFVGVSRTLE